MPLIALDILEAKLKELLLSINRLNEENEALKKQLLDKSGTELPAEAFLEIEKMKKLIQKYRGERSVLYTKIASAIKRIDEITGGPENDG
ncbi:MAG TPA: hypothetical protein ENN43_07005 [bacterium]|nr:hypothetical protein [bacterium]